jgi:hypothetical protein
MIRAAGSYPYDASTRHSILRELQMLLEGYVAVADPPLSLLCPELLELYPDAKVIVTGMFSALRLYTASLIAF